MPKSLAEIAQFTDKNGAHPYVKFFYEEAFAPYRDKPIDLLEIGIWWGGSLRAWHEYFHNAASIYGVDTSPNPCPQGGQHKHLHAYIKALPVKPTNIHLRYGNAYDSAILPSLDGKRFDIIIDDGSHSLPDQKAFLARYLPLLKEDGLAIIEDVPDAAYFTHFKAMLPAGFHGYPVDLRPRAAKKTPQDDMLYVVHRQLDDKPKLHTFGQFSIAKEPPSPMQVEEPFTKIDPTGLPHPQKQFLVLEKYEPRTGVAIDPVLSPPTSWIDVTAAFRSRPGWPKDENVFTISKHVGEVAQLENRPGCYRVLDAVELTVDVYSRPVLEVEIK